MTVRRNADSLRDAPPLPCGTALPENREAARRFFDGGGRHVPGPS